MTLLMILTQLYNKLIVYEFDTVYPELIQEKLKNKDDWESYA